MLINLNYYIFFVQVPAHKLVFFRRSLDLWNIRLCHINYFKYMNRYSSFNNSNNMYYLYLDNFIYDKRYMAFYFKIFFLLNKIFLEDHDILVYGGLWSKHLFNNFYYDKMWHITKIIIPVIWFWFFYFIMVQIFVLSVLYRVECNNNT